LETGEIATGDGHFEVHLPFAGITLFRFDGCNLSPNEVLQLRSGAPRENQ